LLKGSPDKFLGVKLGKEVQDFSHLLLDCDVDDDFFLVHLFLFNKGLFFSGGGDCWSFSGGSLSGSFSWAFSGSFSGGSLSWAFSWVFDRDSWSSVHLNDNTVAILLSCMDDSNNSLSSNGDSVVVSIGEDSVLELFDV
jgi:hypothetical protein